jgi:hypothetical protein
MGVRIEGEIMRARAKSTVVPLIVRPRDARVMLSCSQKTLYLLINANELESFRDRGARKITVESINAYISRGLSKSRKRAA